MKSKIKLRLYIIGQSARAQQAFGRLEEIMDNNFKGEYTLEVIDLLERPQLAEEEKIMAAPTVVKNLPLPIRKIVGDLSDEKQVLVGLDLASER